MTESDDNTDSCRVFRNSVCFIFDSSALFFRFVIEAGIHAHFRNVTISKRDQSEKFASREI